MGIPDELLLNPTKEIDDLLTLSPVELVRKEYEAKGMSEDVIDIAIEQDIADEKIDSKAKLIQFNLNQNKENIINTKNQLVAKYTQDKQLAIETQKKQEVTQITEELNKISDFLGAKVSKEAINGIIAKVNKGLYDSELSNPASKATLILYKEFGEKLAKLSKDKALAQGKAEVTSKLSNIPPSQGQSGSRVDMNKAELNDKANGVFSNIPTEW